MQTHLGGAFWFGSRVILFALLGPRLVCRETATSWDWVGPVRDPQLFARVGSELRCGELLKPLKELRLSPSYLKLCSPRDGKMCQLSSCWLARPSWRQCFLSEVTTLHSGSLGSGVDEERSKLRVGM